jgi:integrase
LRLPAEPLSRDELERLLRACGRGPCGERNRALIVLLWRSGLRVAEALALYPKDLSAAAGTVTVLRGKGAQRRQVAVDEYTLLALKRWLARRTELGIGAHARLFCAVDARRRGAPMTGSHLRLLFKELGERAGIGGGNYNDGTRWGKRVHPHGLRHTLAFELLMEGVDVGTIRAQLGHKDLKTTLRYCDHLAPAAAIRVMHQRPTPDFPAS